MYFPFDGPCQDKILIRTNKGDIFASRHFFFNFFGVKIEKNNFIVVESDYLMTSMTFRDVLELDILYLFAKLSIYYVNFSSEATSPS